MCCTFAKEKTESTFLDVLLFDHLLFCRTWGSCTSTTQRYAESMLSAFFWSKINDKHLDIMKVNGL